MTVQSLIDQWSNTTCLGTSGRAIVSAIQNDAFNKALGYPLGNEWPVAIVKLAPPQPHHVAAFMERCIAVGLGNVDPVQAAELMRKPDTIPKLLKMEQRVAQLRKAKAQEGTGRPRGR